MQVRTYLRALLPLPLILTRHHIPRSHSPDRPREANFPNSGAEWTVCL